MDNKILWNDLDIELIKRIETLKLPAIWNFIAQSMTTNFLYSIRKVIEDGLKEKENINCDKNKVDSIYKNKD